MASERDAARQRLAAMERGEPVEASVQYVRAYAESQGWPLPPWIDDPNVRAVMVHANDDVTPVFYAN